MLLYNYITIKKIYTLMILLKYVLKLLDFSNLYIQLIDKVFQYYYLVLIIQSSQASFYTYIHHRQKFLILFPMISGLIVIMGLFMSSKLKQRNLI